jgi:ferric-dicitrate binding protein FerR (iron transport regulator)
MNPEQLGKLSELLGKLRDDAITKEQFAQLDRLLANDPQAQQYYMDYILLCSDLRNCQAAVALDMLAMARLLQTKSPPDHLEASAAEGPRYIWEDLAEYEKNAVVVEVEKVEEVAERILTAEEREARIRAFVREQKAMEDDEKRLAEQKRRKISERELRRLKRIAEARRMATKVRRYLINGAMAAMLMVIGYLVYIIMQPVAPATVATLTDGIDVKWANPNFPTELGSLLQPGPLKLVGGFAEITFDDGTQLIIESPTEIMLEESNNAFLKLGKLSAHVPLEARGFTINTPSASIIDLGTEFSVHVTEDGSSDIHVFKGKVSLMARKLGEMMGKLYNTVEQIVEAGQARRVLTGSSRIQDIQFGETAFVRNMPSPYELAIRRSKPVAYWRFDEGSEESDRSIQYFGNSAIEPVGPDLGDGKTNDALKLNGNNSRFSLVLWVRPDSIARQNIIVNADQEGPYSNYSRQLFMDSKGKFAFWILVWEPELGEVEGEPVTLTSSTVMQPGKWYHVAVTVASNGDMHLFINGTEENNLSLVDLSLHVNPERNRIYIGSAACGEDDDRELMRSFTGGLDEIARYNRVLSPPEIGQLYRFVGK